MAEKEPKQDGGRGDRVTVLLPAYNEGEAIGRVVRELVDRYPDHEVLVVDDGSTDRTAEDAAAAGARVVRHDWNRGYGSALRTGCREARGDILCFFDADGQHRAADVSRLVDAMRSSSYDMVVGQRDAGSHVPAARRPGKWVLRAFADFLAGCRIPDVNSGLRAVRRDVMMRYLHLTPAGFSFSTTTTFAFLKSGRSIGWVPVTVEPRVGVSSVSQLRHGLQTVLLLLRLTTLFEPLKVFLPVSGVFLCVAIGFLVANLLAGRAVPQTSVIMSVSSVIVFMMGLLMDQVSAIRREKHE